MLSRRQLLLSATAPLGPDVKRELFVASPGKGTAVMASAFYTGRRGGGMMSMESRWSRSDTIDVAFLRYSGDYGRTWSKPEKMITGEKRPNGMWRKHARIGWVDPHTGRFIQFWLEGLLPTDDPLEGLREWRIHWAVSKDDPRAVRGTGLYDHKGVMLGDQTCQPVSAADGGILLPVQIPRFGPDGNLLNPGGGYTWHDSAVLHGRWNGWNLDWRMSEVIRGDPARTTRGFIEPTLAHLGGRRWMLVLRGSNDARPQLPSWRWVSFSDDGGWKWSDPAPWTYDDGQPFYSPSACSQLLPHSSGRLYWLGNINPENPRGNRPRYPFMAGEVDRRSGRLIRRTIKLADTLQPGEDPLLTLSNFYAREDRQSREICVHMTRLFAKPDGWEGDAMLYRVAP
ncbi:MAG: exo-alpha-sialidase [Candidatus Solibacter usitatus]|nr:exo-alpha-sialidase [Candidatus Solibacter usitatus]